jgi:hypothetical protein
MTKNRGNAGERGGGGGGGGGGGDPLRLSQVFLSRIAGAGDLVDDVPMSIGDFVQEMSALVGSMKLTFQDGHAHIMGPLDAEDKRRLRITCEGMAAYEIFSTIVVRRVLPVPDVNGIQTYLRCYIVLYRSGVIRLTPAANRKSHMINTDTGEYLGDEDGVKYE